MPFSAYDSDALRLLSAALSEALESVRKSAKRPLTESETAGFSKRLAAQLMEVFDRGERDPAALKRAALQGIYLSAEAVSDAPQGKMAAA